MGTQPPRHAHRPPSVELVVLDGEHGKPIADARVAAYPTRLEVMPSGRGKFLIPLSTFSEAFVMLEASAPGYGMEQQIVGVEVARPTTVAEIALTPGVDVRGYVRGPTGRSIRGAKVFLASARGAMRFRASVETVTDDEGRFSFRKAVARGKDYLIAAAYPGLVPSSVYFVAPADELVVDLGYTASHVTVLVVAPNGKPIPGAEVFASLNFWEEPEDGSDADGRPEETTPLTREDRREIDGALRLIPAFTDDTGSAELFLPAGEEVVFEVYKAHWWQDCDQREAVSMREDSHLVRIRLDPVEPGDEDTTRLLIKDSEGSPLRSAPVFLLPSGQTSRSDLPQHGVVWTDAEGYLQLGSLSCRELSLWTEVGVFGPPDPSLGGGDTRSVHLRAPERAVVRLVDEAGSPVSGVLLEMTHLPQMALWMRRETDERGEAAFANLVPGKYRLADADSWDPCIEGRVLEVPASEGKEHVFSVVAKRPEKRRVVRGVCLQDDGKPLASGVVLLLYGGYGTKQVLPLCPWDEGRFFFRVRAGLLEELQGEPTYLCAIGGAACQSCRRVDLASGNAGVVDVAMTWSRKPGSLTGIIVRGDGSPYRGSVGLVWWSEGRTRSDDWLVEGDRFFSCTETDARGRFCLRRVQTGLPVAVAVPAAGGKEAWVSGKALAVSGRVELSPGEFRDLGVLKVPDVAPFDRDLREEKR